MDRGCGEAQPRSTGGPLRVTSYPRPRSRGYNSRAPPDSQRMPISAIPRSNAGKMKIMIVDDHAEMRRLLRSMLGDLASEFTECADGAEAVAAFARQRPDWTVMDITMKGLDGLEATRRIQEQFAGSRIIVLTQHATPQMRTAALEAGACAFISKDNLAQLDTILRSQL